MSRSVGKNVSRAIKESKWLYIIYRNTKNIITNFWIFAIYDIDFKNKELKVDMLNIMYQRRY